jgi:hypothetical protein
MLLLSSGCAALRTFEVVNPTLIDLDATSSYFVVLPTTTQVIAYGSVWDALDYDEYAGNRAFGGAKPEVPGEIAKYLRKRGKNVHLGSASQVPTTGSIIITYEELWGWDMRPIIKALTISAYPSANPASVASVEFAEMTIFNTQPVASSLVPQMMDELFAVASKVHP